MYYLCLAALTELGKTISDILIHKGVSNVVLVPDKTSFVDFPDKMGVGMRLNR